MAERALTCPLCGGKLGLLKKEAYVDLNTSAILNLPDRYPMDVYSCRGCGKVEFFRANFVPKPERPVCPAEERWQGETVDTTGFYTPGMGEDVKCPRCGKEHPSDDPFCPLCGLPRDIPCAWCGCPFPAGEEVCPHCGRGRER